MRTEKALMLIRVAVGSIFLSEGIQKFLFPQALLLLGLFTRLAAVPLLAFIGTAIVTTKVPMLLKEGFWKAAHESRTDWAMLLGLAFLVFSGSGPWSLDGLRSRRAGR